MKKFSSLVLTATFTIAVGICAQRGRAQVAPATSVQDLGNGNVHLNVTNSSDVPITALAAIGTRTLIANGATDRSIRLFVCSIPS